MVKKSFFIILISLNLLFSTKAWSQSAILILGDSLSASYGMKQNDGWVSLLNQQLKQQNAPYTLINASISGETTAGGLARLPGILSNSKFDYLLIELGGNDGLRGYPPQSIKNNLLQIIQLAQEKQIKTILMDIKIPPNYGPKYNQLFADVFSQVAQKTNSTLMPFFIEKIAVKPSLMQADGIHPTRQAQPMIAELMAQQLKKFVD